MLLDRKAEKDALDRMLGAVRGGLSGALVLRGEAGIGKTALLEYAVEAAGGMRVARVVGVESEIELGYAGLHQLLVPFLAGIEQLPVPQRDALEAAFGLVVGRAPDRFLVGLAALTLLAAAAADDPLLCVVDDAQWLDQASIAAMGFVARRLFADRIALLFGVREPVERPNALDGLTELDLGGLPDPAARGLLEFVSAGRVDEQVRDRIVFATRGNPLALLELGTELTPAELSGSAQLPDPLPISARLEERFLNRVRTLPADAQTLLLLAAAEPSGDAALLWRAANRAGLDTPAADLTAVDRLLVLTPTVSFRHPLMRSAIYRGASATARRRAHEALAAASNPGIDADRRAWHLAAATVGPNEQIAAELERSADRARERGGWAAAAACLARAAELTPDDHRGAVRWMRAARARLAAGAPAVAGAMLERAMPGLVDPLDQAEGRRLEARVRFALGECAPIPAILLDAARALRPLDVTRARETLLEAFEAALYAGRDSGDAGFSAIARSAREAPPSPAMPESSADLLLDGIALLDVDYPTAARVLRRALRALAEGDTAQDLSPQFITLSCRIAEELWDDDAIQGLVDRYLRVARDRGDLAAMLAALAWQVRAETLAGRFAAAEAALAEGRRLSAATGDVGVFIAGSADALQLLAWRGDEARARETAVAMTRKAMPRGAGGFVDYARAMVATLEVGLANYAAALDVARAVYDDDPALFGTTILPDLIEAAARCSERATAAAALERFSDRARASGTELALGLLARSQALLADDTNAERLYIEAIDHLRRCAWAPQLARAHLLYGEWLRRQRRRRDARRELRTAHEMFEIIGAGALAERARVELLATGERARRRTEETRDLLTPQEAQIARLASEGASNQEIGAQLFISPSTVAYHLQKVFRKLEINHRAQLARALSDQAVPSQLMSS